MRAAVVAVILIAAAGALAAARGSPLALTITAEDGQRLWALPVRPGDEVVLVYTHSIYLAPVEEHLRVRPDGFRLTEVRSPSEAVLAYNALHGPYRRVAGRYVAPASARLTELVIRIGRTGRQRLIVGGTALPLYTAGEGARLRIAVRAR
ncbi:MAG TPA: DUF1850 domain-containing protein [bacterium]|nr:DUF1850 domain-containing protein [bacterium]